MILCRVGEGRSAAHLSAVRVRGEEELVVLRRRARSHRPHLVGKRVDSLARDLVGVFVKVEQVELVAATQLVRADYKLVMIRVALERSDAARLLLELVRCGPVEFKHPRPTRASEEGRGGEGESEGEGEGGEERLLVT